MRKGRKLSVSVTIFSLVVVLGGLAWFLTGVFEGEQPEVAVTPLPMYLSGPHTFRVSAADMKRGLKSVTVSLAQGGRSVTVFEKKLPFTGFSNCDGCRRFETKVSVDPAALNLAQGRVDMVVRVRDHSRRSGGDGNLTVVQHAMVVDTIPPALRAVSRMHYVNVGGTGLVVYQVSSDAEKSGVFVGDLFFPGFAVEDRSEEGIHVCYFTVPVDRENPSEVYLWAEDRAGATSRGSFNYRIRTKRFPLKQITITDRFLTRIMSRFSSYPFEKGMGELERFLVINREIRAENNRMYFDLGRDTSKERLWSGTWLRLKNAATMAQFGDRRNYLYKGEKIDEQRHLGVDLASLANSEVQAANHGRVSFEGEAGIYGLTVVLEHGQGLASVYSHLSSIGVKKGEPVAKGDVIGVTGQTGLAGGDHLHFGILVNGVFVNPVEFWDGHWIQDNIEKKMALIGKKGS